MIVTVHRGQSLWKSRNITIKASTTPKQNDVSQKILHYINICINIALGVIASFMLCIITFDTMCVFCWDCQISVALIRTPSLSLPRVICHHWPGNNHNTIEQEFPFWWAHTVCARREREICLPFSFSHVIKVKSHTFTFIHCIPLIRIIFISL